MKWTENETSIAITLLMSGKTYSEIANYIGKTPKAVRMKLNKKGYVYSTFVDKKSKKCKQCSKPIYKSKYFCSNSCSAKYNNIRKIKKYSVSCLNCEKTVINANSETKFCSRKCCGEFRTKGIFQQIKNGTGSFNSETYKKFMISKYGEKCMLCDWAELNTNTNSIPIELHHIDGDSDNNKVNNLQLLCPNCHSLTKYWKGATKGNGRYSKRQLRRQENYRDGKAH